MEKRFLGNTDMEVSVVGFGGIPIQQLSLGEAERVLLRALERGINFFDSARGYTDSEEKIGIALSAHRDKIFLASKALSRSAAKFEKELEASLRNLRADMIDLYQLHSVDSLEQLEKALAPGGAYEALTRAREAGKIRWIGITGHSRSVHHKALQTGLFDTAQFPFNPIESEWETDFIPAAKEAGIGTIGMKPAAGGAISNVKHSILFTLNRGIDVSIPGMNSTAQVDENTSIGDRLEPLTDTQLDELRREREIWSGKFCRRCAYCMPCPNGLNIPFLFLIEAYYTRYNLREWALARLKTQKMTFKDCDACGECLEKCPYELPIPDLMADAARRVI
jgi:predicted aldo/keto reductase-like oxidoreductase